MKVKELIKELKRLDKDEEVYIINPSNDSAFEINSIVKVNKQDFFGEYKGIGLSNE